MFLAALVLVCFVPRAWICLDRDAICPDAVSYMDMADALERGDWDRALGYLNLNIYPPILVALRHTGFEWTEVAAWWSVVLASLAVLPLWGLVRRMFDDRVAVISCLLYAVHPYLLAYSPEIIRDPTHWFLFLLSLYLIWRATAEARWPWFVATGAALTLAVHLRSEAWLLVLPLFGWAAWRWFENPARRRRLVAGTLVSLAMIPATIVVVNLTVLADHPRWEWGCMRPVACVRQWAERSMAAWNHEAGTTKEPQGTERHVGSPTPKQARPLPPKKLKCSTALALRKVLVRMVKTLTYPYGLLALVSLWIDRRELIRPRDLPLVLICIVLVVGMAVRLTISPISPRYFVIVVLLALPRVARGMILLGGALAALVERLGFRLVRPNGVLVGLVLPVLVWGTLAGWNTAHQICRAYDEQAAMGRWILATLGPEQRIGCNLQVYYVLTYYAQGKAFKLRQDLGNNSVAFEVNVERHRPDAIVLWEDGDLGKASETCRVILRDRERLGYRAVRAEEMPPGCPGIWILLREDSASATPR